jgi:hypothetical protein
VLAVADEQVGGLGPRGGDADHFLIYPLSFPFVAIIQTPLRNITSPAIAITTTADRPDANACGPETIEFAAIPKPITMYVYPTARRTLSPPVTFVVDLLHIRPLYPLRNVCHKTGFK